MKSDKTLPHIGVGYQIGHLTVDYPTDKKRSGYKVWNCKCDCGGEILLDRVAVVLGLDECKLR